MREPPLILVVDDAPALALILSRALAKAGYEVAVAHDGFRAVELALERNPDLVLLDMTMPGRDGLETCRLLKGREETASIPVIFVTAHADAQRVMEAFAAGGSDHVSKPFRVEEVLARVSVHLRLREAEQGLIERNVQLEKLMNQLAEANTELARQFRVDALTQLLNRRAWDESALLEHERSARYEAPHTVLMIDIDHFKALNDSQGHQAGDECLRRVAACIASTCRTTDLVGRYGGEEFVVLAPETSIEAGMTLAERVRQAVWALGWPNTGSSAGRITVSIGVAASGDMPLDAVVGRADAALYLAKQGGRNLVHGRRAPTVVNEGEENAPAQEGLSAEPDDANEPLILVVDDEPANRRICAKALANEAYTIEEARDGRSALDAVARFRPDVIVMDVNMPEMDGLECTRQLKADPGTADIPIIMVSARNGTGDVVAGLSAGADEYLTKPVNTAELLVRVRAMVRLFRDRRDLLGSYHLRAEQIRVLTVLLDLCRAVGAAGQVEELLEHAIAAIAEITASRRVSIMLPDEDRAHLRIVRCRGLDEALATRVRVPIGRAIAGQVFATRRAIVCNTEAEARRHHISDESLFFASVPLMSAPLTSGGEILGVVNATDRIGRRPYDPRELEYIELIANVVGSALHTMNSRHARDEARDLVVVALAKLAEHRDNDTARHVERVTRYTQMLAEELRRGGAYVDRIDDDFIGDLSRAAPLHDIGKVAIPDSILRKPGKLTVHEMAVMRTHAEIGAETLRPVIAKVPDIRFLQIAVEIIHAHHEWYDGSGYPRGLKGCEIPLSARIVALADVYDALTTDRVYQEAFSHERAAEIIFSSSGTQFDPAVVNAFRTREAEFRRLARELADGRRAEAGVAAPVGVPQPATCGTNP